MATPERRRSSRDPRSAGGSMRSVDGDSRYGGQHERSRVDDYWHAVGVAREWVGNSQPWNRFVGWQGWDGRIETMSASMQRAWSVPTQAELGGRVSQNLTHYLTNYAVVCAITLLYVIFTHWGLLLWSTVLLSLYVAWDNRHYLANRAGVTFPDIQLPCKPQHASLMFSVVGATLVITLVGHDVFVFIGMASTLVLSHALFRTPRSENAKKSDRAEPSTGGLGMGGPEATAPPEHSSSAHDAAPSVGDGESDGEGQGAPLV